MKSDTILDRINIPADMKGLSREDLKTLAKDVRNEMGFLNRGGKVMKRGGKV